MRGRECEDRRRGKKKEEGWEGDRGGIGRERRGRERERRGRERE